MNDPIVLAIDPGTERSGVVVYDAGAHRVIYAAKDDDNERILAQIHARWYDASVLVQEDIENQGQVQGRSTVRTVRWTGRFDLEWRRTYCQPFDYVFRNEVRVAMCGRTRYKHPLTGKIKGIGDAEVRRAVIERFPATGGGETPEIGKKARPGPLYGVSSHAFQALAVALTWCQIKEGIVHNARR